LDFYPGAGKFADTLSAVALCKETRAVIAMCAEARMRLTEALLNAQNNAPVLSLDRTGAAPLG
jgi:hypothetical protein